MKWMFSAAFVICAAAAALAAQSALTDMKMSDTMQVSYSGCVAAGSDGRSFVLTHLTESAQTSDHKGLMDGKAAMEKKDGPGMSEEMAEHGMMLHPVFLTGRADLKKYVGQKVAVAGALSHGMSQTMAGGRDILKVASLKVTAKSCS